MLEIGGVKEKVLAAYRAGLREVILPKGNEKDLRDVPQEVRARMAFTFASTMDEVFHLALLPHPDAVHADVQRGDTASADIVPSAAREAVDAVDPADLPVSHSRRGASPRMSAVRAGRSTAR